VKHSEIRARLSEYLERELPHDERSLVGAHLETCSDCERELRELHATVLLLRGLPEPALPPGLGAAVMARIAQGEGREARIHALFRRAAEPRFAAPLAAGLAGLFFLFQAPDDGPAQPMTMASGVPASDEMSNASLGFWDGQDGFDPQPASARETNGDSQVAVISGFTPSAAYHQYVSQVRREEARRRAQIQEVARQLRGAGHPNSASVAAHFESRPTITLADWQPR